MLNAVVERSDWWRTAKGEGVGHGLAWARYKNGGAWCAVIARVEAGAAVRVTHLDLAVDVGTVVDLDGVVNQMEGGAIQAASWTLKEQVTLRARRRHQRRVGHLSDPALHRGARGASCT